jgi:hypothetical protein
MIDRHEADIVGSGFKAHHAQPIRVQGQRRACRVFRRCGAHALHRRMIGKLHHRQLHKSVYTDTYACIAPARGLAPDLNTAYTDIRTPRRNQRVAQLEHDPEKWNPVFGKDHAQQMAGESGMTI